MLNIVNQIQNVHDKKGSISHEKALDDFTQYSIKTVDIKAISDKAVNMIEKSLNVEFCSILEYVSGSNSFIMKSGTGWNGAIAEDSIMDLADNSLFEYTLMNKEPIIVENIRTDKRFNVSGLFKKYGITSSITVNINEDQKSFGVLWVYSINRQEFSECDIYFLKATANIIAMAINHARLQSKQEVFLKAIEHYPNIIMITDTNGKINYINHKFADKIGNSVEEILNGKIDILELNRTHPEVYNHLLNGINSGNVVTKEFDYNKNGKIDCWERVKVTPVKDKKGVVTNFLVAKMDISLLKQIEKEKKEVEEQLIHLQKMEDIGLMAEWVARDFNDLRTAIKRICVFSRTKH